MLEWYPVKNLVGLPGMPGTERGVHKKAASENWQKREKPHGKGWEYHVSSLPTLTRDHLAKKATQAPASLATEAGRRAAAKLQLAENLESAIEQRHREQSLIQAMSLTGKAKERDFNKDAIIAAFRIYETLKKGDKSVIEHFVIAYNRGEIEIGQSIRAAIPSTSPASFRRWLNAAKEGKHLGGHYGHRRGSGKLDSQPELREFVLGLMVDKPHISCKLVHDALEARFAGRNDLELPGRRALERWMGQWKGRQAEIFEAIRNPDGWKNKHMVAVGSLDADAPYANAKWQIDSTPADLELIDGRYVLIGLIDVFSRRGKLLVSKTSKATAVSLSVRRALLDWGVPDEIKGDNGQEYVSRHMHRVADSLKIHLDFSHYFSPWEKGNIERFFRSFAHGLASLLPGFIGHNVADRQALRARQSFADRLFNKNEVIELKMTATELQKFCDDWCENIYHHEAHGGLNGKTPFEKAAECREPIKWISNERALDLLLAEAPDSGFRTVQKKGIKIDNDWFIAPELERYVGQKVQVLSEPSDLGRVVVYAYDRPDDPLDPNAIQPGLHFVCLAECPARIGISRQEHAAKAVEIRERQKKRVQEEKRKLKQLSRKVGTDTVVDEILEHKRQQAAAKLVQFPKKKIEHRTAGIEAAEQALSMMRDPSDRELTVAEVEDMQARTQAAPKTVRPMFESMFQRALWTAEVMMGDRQAELSGDDHEFMRELRRLNPATYRSVEDILNLKYEERWDEYSTFRRAVGWPEARRPRG